MHNNFHKLWVIYVRIEYIFLPRLHLDKDECSEGTAHCSGNTECINTDGSYICNDCKPGYSGDGVKCAGKMLYQ